jgi:hypothetical protein
MSRYRQTMAEALEQVREANQKPYVSMSSGGQYNVLDKDGKTAYSTKDKTLAYDYFKKNYDNLKEQDDKDHEISMARGELEAIADKATQLSAALQGKSDEGNPLEAWVQSKITKAKDYINSVSDYMMYKPEEVEEATYGWTLVSKAKDLAKKFKDNITKAVAEIEKLEKGLSKNPTVDAELRKYNENLEEKYTVVITKKDGTTMELGKYNTSAEAQRYVDQYGKGAKVKKEEIEIEEGKMSDIDALVKDGKSSEEIAKLMKLPVKTVKDILGEEKEVPKGYHRMPDGTIMKDSEHKKEETEKDSKEDSAKEIAALKDQINILKTKLENEKNRAVKPEPNPKTGEVPLTIGIAAAEFKKQKEKKEVKEENLQELSKAERDKRIQRAKDMIKYYDAQKKAALKGPNKAIAKKMLKNETELEEGTKPTDFKVKMKTPSGMKMVKVTVPVKDYKVDMAAIEDAARKKIKGDMMDFDFVGDLKMGESLEEVSDRLKLKVLKKKIKQYKDKVFKKTMSTVKSPLFADKEIEEALEIKEFTSQMIDRLKKSFSTAPKRISPEQANKLSKHLDRIDLNDLRKLVKANIPFVSTVARNKIYKKTGKFEELNVENTSAFNPSVHNKSLGVTTKDLDRAFKKLSNQAQSYVNELLRTGMGTRDAIKKAKQRFNEERRLYVEGIAGLQKKADKSGMPYNILKQVYDRGMAAWKSGHRPGASQQQWAFARVNSFITKSSGTWGGADKDLAAKVKGEK